MKSRSGWYPMTKFISQTIYYRDQIVSNNIDKLNELCCYLNEICCEDEAYEIRPKPYNCY